MKQDEIQVVEAEAVHLAALDGPPQLTEAQERFCQFYVCGGMQYAGQADRCYREVFDIKHGDTEAAARRLVHNPAVMARIRELGTEMISETESIAVKMQISRTLRDGHLPRPLRQPPLPSAPTGRGRECRQGPYGDVSRQERRRGEVQDRR